MKILTLGMSRPKTWKPFAAAIMWADGVDYDHAFTLFQSDSWGVKFIYQQSGARTNFMGDPLFCSLNEMVRVYEIEVTDEVYNAIGALCVKREGRAYGIKQVIAKAFSKLLLILSNGKIRAKFSANGDDETDCIEEQAYLLAQGAAYEVTLDMDTVTVKPYVEFLESLPNIKRVK